MTFNAALTGLRAANTDLEVSGNNIANASTVGFKESRVEFADVYASTNIGGGSNAVGNGVRVANVAQQFSQGSIGFTNNSLDLAINGGGFFILDAQGTQIYTRSGQFGVNTTGQIVSADGAQLQGFPANETGVISGVLDNLEIDTSNISPRQTSEINIGLNLDADATNPVDTLQNFSVNGILVNTVSTGGSNGYTADTITVDGVDYLIPSSGATGANARTIANELTSIDGVNASGTTEASVTIVGGATSVGTGELSINGVEVTGATLNDLQQAINDLSNTTATLNGSTIEIVTSGGDDIIVDVQGGSSIDVANAAGAATTIAPGNTARVGGEVNVNVDDGVAISFANGNNNIFGTGANVPVVVLAQTNTFDPTDEETFTDVTSATIYDSLGAPHVMTSYFVKDSGPNQWRVYVQVDGQDVGDPDPNAADPFAPTVASFSLAFDSGGNYNAALSEDIVISNWRPLDPEGSANGALGPSPGAPLPIPVPATSSNFSIDVSASTQFKSVFAVNSLDQTGYATGQLSGLDIDDSGIIFARYSNGEALILGQVALADFGNEQGLTPIGDTSWAESFQSGPAVVGSPLSAALGSIQSGALEDSNVELAEELVALIIAQRNYQANARTIETANEVTQTIINLR